MGKVTQGDVIAGLAAQEDLVLFGGDRVLQGVRLGNRAATARRRSAWSRTARCSSARPEADPVPALRAAASGLRLPGTPERGQIFVLVGPLAQTGIGSSARSRCCLASSRWPARARCRRGGSEEARCPAGEDFLPISAIVRSKSPRSAWEYAAKKYSQADVSWRPGFPPMARTAVPGSFTLHGVLRRGLRGRRAFPQVRRRTLSSSKRARPLITTYSSSWPSRSSVCFSTTFSPGSPV